MSGTDAVMRRVFAVREREAMDAATEAALAGLAARVRELTEAVVHTAVDPAEAAAVAAEVAALAARLNAARRAEPPIARIGGNGLVRQLANPVSGALNPVAPPVEIEFTPDGGVRTAFTLNGVYEGPPSFVHGGVSAMVLDQLLGAAAAANGTPGMTATLELRYRRPTPWGVPLTATAKVSRAEGRKTWADAVIAGPDGRTTVEATAMFIMPVGAHGDGGSSGDVADGDAPRG
ncbi:PaaI family thioesterase [Actinomadura parmotrematis]|uniref:Acyl-coenzyme A thioesterase THEM4 n=1 Tax=Actinomadura parmotrematis TaxID=2864039 RepID=A0ABS7FTI8_9ACTN|nr:PaaI family thioesterase [Actinomadura parmotrematis]MBW8483725.1 PaaI family thioesterase [Actinomadura parmotrematis]